MSNTLSSTPFGTMSIDPLFSADTLAGVGRRSTRWQVLESFLRSSEGCAERIFEGSSGLIILMGIPGQPGTGVFYLYDEINRHFFMLNFEAQDNFHSSIFDYVTQFYDLGQFVTAAKPRLVEKRHFADKTNVSNPSQNKAHHNQNRRHKQRRFHVPQAVIAGAAKSAAGVVATA